MQRVATGWLIYRLTSSPFWLGIVEFASLFTAFLIAPFAGVLADRLRRRDMFLVSQILATIQALLLWKLVMAGNPTVTDVLWLTVLLGVCNGVEYPVRQSFVIELVDDPVNLGNAIALNSLSFNGSRLVGPALGGVMIALYGEAPCFLFNAVSYLAAIVMLLLLRLPDRRPATAPRLWSGMKEGLKYAWEFKPVRHLMSLLSLFGFFVLPVTSFLPVFARDILVGDARLLGVLSGAIGVGATMAACWMLGREKVEGLERIIGRSALIYGCALFCFCFSRSIPLSVVLLVVMGNAMILVWVPANTLLQNIIDDRKRGRVMSLYIMCFMGAAPLGSLVLGWVARWYGVPAVLTAGAVCCCIGARRFLQVRDDFYEPGLNRLRRDISSSTLRVPHPEGVQHG